MTSPKKIIVKDESSGGRLDIFLSDKLEISRSQVQKMIDKNQIDINGHAPKKYGEKLGQGDIITLVQPKEEMARIQKRIESRGTKNADETQADPMIIFESDDYLIVNKPSGLLTHPTEAKEENSLSGWLLKKYPEIKIIGEDPMRPGIVHRLDKEASGLLVIARTQQMFRHLKEQFKNRTIYKEYDALVHGKIEREEGSIDFPIARSETSEKMAAIPQTKKGLPNETGKEAKTEFFVEKHFINFTLLKVKIHTGRMHQIRAHMLAYNHPVVGDPLYFQKKQKRDWDKKCGRLFLHSARIGFKNLDGEFVEYETELPNKLRFFLTLLT